MSNPVTIVALAKELKISPSTVSRALRDHPAIKQETKDLVIDLAKKLGYQPNNLALSLLYKKTNNIGVIVPEITSYFFSSIICGIQDVLEPEGQHIMIMQSNESYEAERRGIDAFIRSQVDGILISSSFNTNDYSHLDLLVKNEIPFVVFDRDCEGVDMNKVLVDDYDGACQAVQHLIDQGCKRIAHISGPDKLSIARHRKEGYLDTLRKNGFEIDEHLLCESEFFQMEDGIPPTKKLMNLPNPPDGIFVVNDGIAIGVLSALRDMNMKIPQQIAVIGFDNDPYSEYTVPSLSTIDQPVYEMGMLAARVLQKCISKSDQCMDFRTEILKPELIVRTSSLRKAI